MNNSVFKLGVKYTVGCPGVAQLGVPTPGFVRGGLAKAGACKSILFTKSSCVVKINNTCYIRF